MVVGRLVYATYRDREYQRGRREPSRYLHGVTPVSIYREDLRAVDDKTFERDQHILAERANNPRDCQLPQRVSPGIALSGSSDNERTLRRDSH